MDNDELRSLLKEVVLEVLSEINTKTTNTPNKPVSKPKKPTTLPKKRTTVKKTPVKKTTKQKDHNSEKLKLEPWRKTFIDNLEDEVYIETDKGKINLVEIDKQIAKLRPKKQKKERSTEKTISKKCDRCGKKFDAFGRILGEVYLDDLNISSELLSLGLVRHFGNQN